MAEIAHGVMLAGALAGTGATLARGRRLRALDALAALAMLAAMLDTAFTGVLPGVAWAAVLVLAGLAIGIRSRLDRSRRSASAVPKGPRPVGSRSRPLHDLHHALALIATGWLVAAAGRNDAGVSGATHAHAAALLPAGTIVVLAVVALGAWVAARALREGRRGVGHGVMAASMTVMLAAMAAPGLATALGA
ncbi:DUF5134 domain-containing protein [Agromyces bracchium]|uniref:DUF5134 domain-containing protein n=1 Tax=Agromyces bracchium TaxID=88376 RepID=A0A6I3M9K6_9MICO|nr:DUF5134 domain-containing protein [Agromyces bracchium]MTH69661.1 hypothetical protein [Agromyces bracchium]